MARMMLAAAGFALAFAAPATAQQGASRIIVDPGKIAPHYGYFEEDTVLQINGTGPWSVTYVNPADDPRNKRP